MNPPKQNRRKPGANRLDPIDWHEFANDAVLNGNMSTLFHRPPTEDPSAYASPEALVEIEKRTRGAHAAAGTPAPSPQTDLPAAPEAVPPSLDATPSSDLAPGAAVEMDVPTVGPDCAIPTAGPIEAIPTVGTERSNKKIKPVRSVHDALTLAGQILYQAMYGPPDGTAAKQCAKGYRQLAAETRLDKDTVRDLIADFKDKGIVREIASYNPDTRSPKTYEVLSNQAIVDLWREAGLWFVTSGRQRPEFCTAQGHPHRPLLAR
jgi:hypothetical protein